MIHTVKGFGIINKAEVDISLELSCFFYDPMDIGNLISGSSAFSKFSLYPWKFLVHILLKPSLKDFEHYLASMWNQHNCAAAWTLLGIAFLWYWNENWPSPFLRALLSFPHLLAYWVQHFNSIISWKNLKNISSSFRMQQFFRKIILPVRPSTAYFREFYTYTLDFMIFFSARQSYNWQLLGNVLRIFFPMPKPHICQRSYKSTCKRKQHFVDLLHLIST